LLPFCLGMNSLLQEKAKRIVESLMATPLGIKPFWWGKSLGAFLPAFIVNLIVILIITAALNFIIIEPVTGHLVFSLPALVTSLVILPLLILPLVLILTLVFLIADTRTATIIGVLVAVGFAQIPAQVFPRIGIQIASWNFSRVLLGVTVLLWIIAAFLTRFLTTEKVILSSKA